MTEAWFVDSREDWERQVDLRIAASAGLLAVETPSAEPTEAPTEVDVLMPSRRHAVQALEQGFRVTALSALSGELRISPNGDAIEIGQEHIVIRGGVRKDEERNAPHYHVSVNDYRDNIFPTWNDAKHVNIKNTRHKRIRR